MPLTSYQHQESWRSLRRASRCLSYCPSGSGEEGCSGIDRLEGRLSNLDPELSDSTRGEAEKQLRPCAVAEAHPKGVMWECNSTTSRKKHQKSSRRIS